MRVGYRSGIGFEEFDRAWFATRRPMNNAMVFAKTVDLDTNIESNPGLPYG